MGNKVYPAIILGLGKDGCLLADAIMDGLAADHSDLVPVTRALFLDATGLQTSWVPDSGLMDVGSVVGHRHWEPLETTLAPGVWATNYGRVLAGSKAIQEAIAE